MAARQPAATLRSPRSGRPWLGFLIVTSLALGIGVTSTVGSIAQAVLLRPLPFRAPEHLVVVGEVVKANPGLWEVSSYPDYLDWASRNHVFSSLAISRPWTPLLKRPAEPVRLAGAEVSADFCSLLGLRTELGRPLGPDDFRPAATPVAVLSHRLWQQQFGGDPQLVGKAIPLDGTLSTVVGILPAGNAMAEPLVIGDAEILKPLVMGAKDPYAERHGEPDVARLERRVTELADVSLVLTVALSGLAVANLRRAKSAAA